MRNADFVVVGSSGGGGTIAWLLAKAGYSVVILEQGTDWAATLKEPPEQMPGSHAPENFNPVSHDEYRFRIERPELKRHPRGDYNTFRETAQAQARPFGAGWTGSMLGGGSVIWGAWCFRALPIDFQLATLFGKTPQLKQLQDWGYSVPDWAVSYREMSPYYNIAESLLAVCGNRKLVHQSIVKSRWYAPLDALVKFNVSVYRLDFRTELSCNRSCERGGGRVRRASA